MQVQVVGVQYNKPGVYGDFNWMIKQSEYSNALFIFNDNEEHHETCIKGHGNASIRIYNRFGNYKSQPRSAGIPTGTLSQGGYSFLTSNVQKTVDNSIQEIKQLIQTFGYTKIFYSVGPSGKLGTSIFNVDSNVIEYIDGQIRSLELITVELG